MILQTKGLCKSFSGVSVLRNIDFDLDLGEIHALAGENGAGKSTFIKMLSGVYSPDSGTIELNGKRVNLKSIEQSEKMGIRSVQQEISLISFFKAYQNIFIGDELKKSILGIKYTDDKAMRQKAEETFKKLHSDINPDAYIHNLDVSRQRIIQIAKIFVQNPKVMIFDEPTTSLGEKERSQLLQIIKSLKGHGIGIIYISHNLDEIMEIADRITVFRDGEKIGTKDISQSSKQSIISMMIGKKEYIAYSREKKPDLNSKLLEISGLENEKLKGINLILHKGEILGIAGVMGAGKSELAKALFGLDKVRKGHFRINDARFYPNIQYSLKNRIAFVPEERQAEGLIPSFTVERNISIAYLDSFKKRLRINSKKETKIAEKFISTMGIKTTGPQQGIKYLSGGNQQKTILSRWLYGDFNIGLLDEPTKGIDVKAKEDIYKLIGKIADSGKGVIFFSSYLPELLTVCDRIIVMVNGAIKGEYYAKEPDAEEKIFEAMLSGESKYEFADTEGVTNGESI